MAHEPVITPAKKKSWDNQREWLEDTLRKAGTAGITNRELVRLRNETFGGKGTVGGGLAGRISELRDELYEKGEAVHSEPVDGEANVWKHWIGPLTPEYTADHLKRRKPKMRSDNFVQAVNLLRYARNNGSLPATIQAPIEAYIAKIEQLGIDK